MRGACTRTVRLRPGVRLLTAADGAACLAGGNRRFPLPAGTAPVVRALARRACAGPELAAGRGDAREVRDLLVALEADGWLETTVSEALVPRYSLSPAPAHTGPGPVAHPPRLSAQAVITPQGGCLVVTRASGGRAVRLFDPELAAFLATIAGPSAPRGAHTELVEVFLRDLAECGLLAPAEEAEAVLLPHELWFHANSHLRPDPRTRVAPLAGRTRHDGEPVPLPRPDLAAVSRRDPTLTRVMEDRRSVREHDDDAPLSTEQLSELLYRVFRVRGTRVVENVELRDRPVPAGGSLHELEVYPVVHRVAGLTAGLYHYNPDEHRLVLLAHAGAGTERLLAQAAGAGAMTATPQVLLVFTARVDRLAWKYRGLSYSLVLKHVGVAQQALYLVATAMGLAPCALGDGDRAGFAAVSGTNPVTEPAVGEFLVGSRKGDPGAGGS